ncbi:hypothetical protein MRB53_002005 [Persea americana]|uniref:Uncharacterized protein n=1 Tax=Persea americana TaxID=3435 RepID=A0ACC2MT99_PERAE|nr:hypothetical protein MRB53_002005 [Persea americana]
MHSGVHLLPAIHSSADEDSGDGRRNPACAVPRSASAEPLFQQWVQISANLCFSSGSNRPASARSLEERRVQKKNSLLFSSPVSALEASVLSSVPVKQQRQHKTGSDPVIFSNLYQR